MSRGINKVILIGRLGKDPEVRYMPSGGAVANASLATSEQWKDKNSGENKERTEWHNLVFYRRLAEIAGEYLKKGALIYVEGKLTTEKWQDKDGKDRYTTKIVVNEMQMLGDYAARKDEDEPPLPAQGKPAVVPQTATDDSLNDDIPF